MSSACRRFQGYLLNSNGLLKRCMVERVRFANVGVRYSNNFTQSRMFAAGSAMTATRVNALLNTAASRCANQQRNISVSFVHQAEVVKAPGFPESVAQGDLKWLKKIGDAVSVDEIVAEIETDKTMIPVPSPFSGVITELIVADGAKVTSQQPLFKVQAGEGAPAAKQPEEPAAKPQPKQAEATVVHVQAQAQVQQQAGAGTGAGAGGLRRPPPPAGASQQPAPTATSPQTSPQSSAPAASAPKSAPKAIGVSSQQKITPGVERILGTRSENRVRMSRLRLRIAERLKDAQNTCAMLTTFNEVDMTSALEMRKKYGDAFLKKHGIKLGIMGPFVKAAAYALDQMPIVNAVIDKDEIVYRDYIDISVAVSAPRGLVVPVIRGVESMNYVDIERAIAALGEKARKETLTIEDMEGGTFTVSNGGVFGSLISTPIINLPQSAILGMHATFDRPVAINGKVEIRPMMYITMTYDHRLIDGREAVTFLRTIKTAVEDPRILQLDI